MLITGYAFDRTLVLAFWDVCPDCYKDWYQKRSYVGARQRT